MGAKPPAGLIACLLVLCVGGCPFAPSGDGLTDSFFPFLDKAGNSSFDTATALSLQSSDKFQFSGEISDGSDVDIYGLGSLAPGDRLVVDVQAASGSLDAVAAVFDSRRNVHAYNDDRVPDLTNLNPLIDVVVRGPQGDYFLGISGLPGSNSAGSYRVTVRVERGVGLPAPAPQVVFLDWNGGQNLVVENVGVFNLAPFSAADVGLSAEVTDALKSRVEQIVRDRYQGFNLVLLSSDRQAEPSGPHTKVYFGGTSRRAFAISQHIDTMNADPSDNSIVFTGAFDDAFSHPPSLEEMATALGNTVAHEVGHLLGLLHTASCDDLMDTSCGNDRILLPQAFGTAPLDRSVFATGNQDALEMLGWLLGLSTL